MRAMLESAWGAAVTFFPRREAKERNGGRCGGDAPCGAEYDAEDEGAQGARVRESHGMRERPIPLGDFDSPMSRGPCADPRRRTSESSASTDQASRPVGDLTRETSGPSGGLLGFTTAQGASASSGRGAEWETPEIRPPWGRDSI